MFLISQLIYLHSWVTWSDIHNWLSKTTPRLRIDFDGKTSVLSRKRLMFSSFFNLWWDAATKNSVLSWFSLSLFSTIQCCMPATHLERFKCTLSIPRNTWIRSQINLDVVSLTIWYFTLWRRKILTTTWV